MESGAKFVITVEVSGDGTTHTKINLSGYSILEAKDCLVKAIEALREEHIAMIEHHFPNGFDGLVRGSHLHEGAVIRILDENPEWASHPPSSTKGAGR